MGRPRGFDIAEALDRALEVFWRHGYEGTTIPDLTSAMKINRPSLYAAFGNKEALFRKVVEHYLARSSGPVEEALARPTAREVAEALLRSTVEMLTLPDRPGGCLLVQGALACSAESECLKQELARWRGRLESAIRERLDRAVEAGELRGNAATLARFLATVMQGMSVQRAGGAGRDELMGVAEMALRAWPT
jgi:AcrR family transcriptional regulator